MKGDLKKAEKRIYGSKPGWSCRHCGGREYARIKGARYCLDYRCRSEHARHARGLRSH